MQYIVSLHFVDVHWWWANLSLAIGATIIQDYHSRVDYTHENLRSSKRHY